MRHHAHVRDESGAGVDDRDVHGLLDLRRFLSAAAMMRRASASVIMLLLLE